MASLVGTILDVSESMKICVDTEINRKKANFEWVYYIFEVIDDLVELDVPFNNRIFVAGVGSTCGKIFDIVSTIQKFQDTNTHQRRKDWDYDKIVKEMLDLLESNGAKTVRKYAHEWVIKKVLSRDEAEFLFHKLQYDNECF